MSEPYIRIQMTEWKATAELRKRNGRLQQKWEAWYAFMNGNNGFVATPEHEQDHAVEWRDLLDIEEAEFSPEELADARAALARLKAREGEDIEKWAEELAKSGMFHD